MSADKAGPGEVWLSSQNRNFRNRMGPGAIGSITSAATVAASSFDMKITDPASLIDQIDKGRMKSLLRVKSGEVPTIVYVEPPDANPVSGHPRVELDPRASGASSARQSFGPPSPPPQTNYRIIRGKVQTLGDFIDTDALAPAESLIGNLSASKLGAYCLYHIHPAFRQRVKDGLNIVVAGKAFGVGSSRETAVSALMGCGVQCVIARSFAFIYSRNQPNLGLLGIVMEDEDFYRVAVDGVEVEVRVDERSVIVGGGRRFGFELSDLEVRLWEQGGISPAFTK